MQNAATAEVLPPPDWLLRKHTMLNEKFDGLSERTAQRRLFPRPDFPKPIAALGDNFYSEREIDAFILTLRNEGQK